jgi:predicted ATPase/DNA-binding SARP family transcriptional activator
MLQLYLFGAPRLSKDDRPVALRRTRALALLIYLVVTGQPHERDALVALLWPEFDNASARNNLRRELSLLRRTLGETFLLADRQQIALDPHAQCWVDVVAFRAQLDAARQLPGGTAAWAAALQAAVDLADAEFLAGFGLPDSPDFEEWQFFQRESLRQQLATALTQLVAWHRNAASYGAALPYARRLLALDPLHEPAQRELIRLYALDGQYAAALRQYEACIRLFATELGVELEAATHELAASVKARRLTPDEPGAEVSAALAGDHNDAVRSAGVQPANVERELAPEAPVQRDRASLPPRGAGFVGRTRELADIIRRLTDPDCRLLTLAGPGGVGKTQLALQVAHVVQSDLGGSAIISDGVCFVDLVPVTSPEGIVAALGAALRFTFAPAVPPQAQLFAYLQRRRILLVLDNFEHLLDGTALIAELLAAAPGVRLLITSRTALNLSGEWFHPVDGLAFPAADPTEVAQLAHYDAVRLFEQLARQARGDFRLSSALGPVIRLCQLVEGMPLALELAAGWLKTLTVEQIVTAIERDPNLLSSRDRTLPDRHRNLRTVFEATWRLLTSEEQAALVGLTVFVGAFSPEAAQAVTGVSLETLAHFVERSLLRAVPAGRFHMHELLRQFASGQLPDRAEQAFQRHSSYYLRLLADREARLIDRDWQSALDELGAELGNLRAAWLHAVAQGCRDLIDQALYSLVAVLIVRSDFHEGRTLLARAAESLAGQPSADPLTLRMHARVLIHQAAFHFHLGDNAEAAALAQRGLALADGLQLERDQAHAQIVLGRIAGWAGDAAVAQRHLETALQIAQSLDPIDNTLLAQVSIELAWLCCSYGTFADSLRPAEAGLTFSRLSARPDLIARALAIRGWSAMCCGDYTVGEHYYRESLHLNERLGSRYGTASALNGLGWTIWCSGTRIDEAQALQERSLALLRTLGNGIWISNVLGDMALLALSIDADAQARALSEEGLALAVQANSLMYRAYHLGILGHLATRAGNYAYARALLHEALHCALATRLWPKVAFVVYHVALLRLREAEAATEPADQAAALQLLAAVAQQPATWAVYRARAEQVMAEVASRLPVELAEAAMLRGRQLDWQVDLAAVIS